MTAGPEPGAAAEAARRLLEGAARAEFEPEGALLLGAAGALAASGAPGGRASGTSGEAGAAGGSDAPGEPRAGEPLEDPGLALVAAAGAAADGGAVTQDELAARARQVPAAQLTPVLSVAESLLARVDPDWAWGLIEELVGAEEAVRSGLGLDVAARIAIDQGTAWTPGVPLPDPETRQLAADATAREAVAGRLRGRDDPRLAALHESPAGRSLFASEARSLLVAAAAVDPGRALELATEMLETHTPARLLQALRLVAGAAARAGLGDEVATKATEDGFVSEQATWAAAAAAAGALRGEELRRLVDALAPRVEDELDPGRELVAGLPLLEALAHGGEAGPLVELADRWRVPPPLLVDQLFHAETALGVAALVGHPGLDGLLARPEERWDRLYRYELCWWTGSDSVRDALAVVAAPPWRPLPGSLADLTGMAPP
jgi:hypothetical protein